MKTPLHLINLYNKTVRRYQKLGKRLKKYTLSRNGSAYQIRLLLAQLAKLKRTLRNLQLHLRIAACTGIITLCVQTSPARAQNPGIPGPFVQQERSQNPLRPSILNYNSVPVVADVDNDGDLDVAVGNYNGAGNSYFVYYRNEGTNTYPLLQESQDPFNGVVDIQANASAPAFADIDGDEDMDLFVGQNARYIGSGLSDSTIQFFRNDDGVFSEQTGPWNYVTKTGNPLHGFKWTKNVNPCFVDMDKDGDPDLVVGTTYFDAAYKSIYYYINDGNGNFAESTLSVTPAITNQFVAPAFADLDDDGDFDMIVGTEDYNVEIKYYRQTSPGNFVRQTGAWNPGDGSGNPFNDFPLGNFSAPAFGDFDGDTDPDLLISYDNGDDVFDYFENVGDGVFEERNGLYNPFDGVVLPAHTSPAFIDMDGDSDLDAVIGTKYSNTPKAYYYRNDDGKYNLVTGEEDPFENITLDYYSYLTPLFVNMDEDPDLELVTGDYYHNGDWGVIRMFKLSNGKYAEVSDEENPFTAIEIGTLPIPYLLDIDNDLDLDLFIGGGGIYNNTDATIHYFENTGTSENPVYTDRTGSDSDPFSSFEFYGYALLNFTDIDHDGDFDLFINSINPYDIEEFVVRFIENKGAPEAPLFEEVPAELLSDTPEVAAPFFTDFDGDGDYDAFMGTGDGTILYYENENPTVAVSIDSATLNYSQNADALLIDTELTLTDPDNDPVIRATVTILDFIPGDDGELTYSPHEHIEGNFDTTTGVLTFHGKDSLAEYQALLRTVAYSFSGKASGERTKSNERNRDFTKTVAFQVFDIDNTTPQVTGKSISITENAEPPPVLPPPVQPGELIIHNAVAPNSTGDNKYMRLLNIPAGNKVSIFNRWGDKVFEVTGYDNSTPGRRFEGLNSDGNALPSGTYFYKIEFTDGTETLTGYLSLKQ